MDGFPFPALSDVFQVPLPQWGVLPKRLLVSSLHHLLAPSSCANFLKPASEPVTHNSGLPGLSPSPRGGCTWPFMLSICAAIMVNRGTVTKISPDFLECEGWDFPLAGKSMQPEKFSTV